MVMAATHQASATKTTKSSMRSLTTTRTVLIGGIITILSVAVCGYVLFQARFIIIGPTIALAVTPPSITNERVVTLQGHAANITRLWLNDRTIYTDQTGYFNEALVLENGYTIATLKAEDRYGRTTQLSREFVFKPQTLIE